MLTATVEFQGRLVKSSIRQRGERVGLTSLERAAKRAEAVAYALNASKSALGIPTDKLRQYNIDKLALISDEAPKRGRISHFSRKSRKRLIDLTARLRADAGGVMITLTYRKNMQDYALAKYHLNSFLKYVARKFPRASLLWRMERQSRGAIHFHILVFGKVWFNPKQVTEAWQKIAEDRSYPDLQYLDGQRAVLAYVSKYVAKLDSSKTLLIALVANLRSIASVPFRLMLQRLLAAWVFGLDIEPYFPVRQRYTGRHWGYRNKENLPYADKKVVVWYYTSKCPKAEAVYFRYKRYVRRAVNRRFKLQSGFTGFTLYADAEQWYKLWCYNIYVDLLI